MGVWIHSSFQMEKVCWVVGGGGVLRPFSDSIPANSKPAYVIDACNPVMCLKTSLYACIFTGINTLMLSVI